MPQMKAVANASPGYFPAGGAAPDVLLVGPDEDATTIYPAVVHNTQVVGAARPARADASLQRRSVVLPGTNSTVNAFT